MNKHHSHTAKTHVVSHSHTHPYTEEEMMPFLAWPSHLFEMMLSSWRGLTPMESWVEKRRTDGKSILPKTDSKETHANYYYMVELPGITRNQIGLHFENGTIMLQVAAAEEQKKKSSYYQHLHSIRRAFTLPVYTDGKAIKAEFKNDVLTITIPKTDKPIAPQSRTIKVT